ncbi:MAG: 50S ribosomal protein L23 [Alphaproteobacteria bacterium]|nr:50S ribosomal protein L23 [Alphaproteobacteria bacterium]
MIFSLQKKAVRKMIQARKTKKTLPKEKSVSSGIHAMNCIIAPIASEKSAKLSAQSIYMFAVEQFATKPLVMEAMTILYKVKPVDVRFSKAAGKLKRHPANPRVIGKTSKVKKAFVQLKRGDIISFT